MSGLTCPIQAVHQGGRSGGPAGPAQEGRAKDDRLLGGDPTGEPEIVDVLQARVHRLLLGREVGMAGDPDRTRREPIEVSRVVHGMALFLEAIRS